MQIPLPALWTAVLYGALLALSLMLGAAVAAGVRLPGRVIGIALAFASGALLAAIGFELVFVPYTEVGALPVIAGAGLGAVVFTLIDLAVERSAAERGWGIVIEQVTEGVPESIAVGATAGVAGVALFASVAISNIPEAISGGVDLMEAGRSAKKMFLAWAGTGALLFVATMAGYLLGRYVGDGPTAVLHAIAGGAALAGVSSEMMPEAYERSGLAVTLATVAGFLIAFGLFTLSHQPGG